MADSMFLVLDKALVPDPKALVDKCNELSAGVILNSDWQWSDLEGWLPATFADEDSGFEVFTDDITSDENTEFAVEDQPGLNFLVELTPRGGPESYACMVTFATAGGSLSSGVLEVDEETRFAPSEVIAWYQQETKSVDSWIKREAKKRKRRAKAKASGQSPEDALDEALEGMVGGTIRHFAACLVLRSDAESMIHGSRFEISKDGKCVAEHGRYAALCDRQCILLRKYGLEPTEEQLAEVQALNGKKDAATRIDENAIVEVHRIVGRWVDSESIAAVSRDEKNAITLEITDGHRIVFVTEDNFSLLSIEAAGLEFVLNGSKISLY